MKPLFDRDGARAFDRRVMDAGVPGLILMENAGRGAAEQLVRRMRDRLERAVIVGGTGQNGGDAWVVARRLLTCGFPAPVALLAGARERVEGDAEVNLRALEAVGGTVRILDGTTDGLEEALAGATVIVDGLFGTGLDRPIAGFAAEVVARINAAHAPVFAIDLPSGVDASTGAVLGVAVEAELTATFAGHKRGLWQMPGRAHAGEVVCVDIGVPAPVARDGLLELGDAARWLPRRDVHAHKGSAGHVLVVAGSPGRTGAAMLAGYGALRGGAGLVTLAARGEAREALDRKVVELMTSALPEGANAARAEVLALARGKAAAAIGPGLGLDADAKALAVALARELPLPAVLDADALTALAEAGPELAREAPAPRTGPGRPKLGVVSREVSLLPRHWEWLEREPNGISAALRRLVEEAMKRDPERQRARRARDATGRVMTSLAGDLPGFEEAMRALYAAD
ncbi:MAG TPA: NAD(P)H-hydrate epimerase, partial [Sandaracinaceae bacterium]